MPQPPLTFMVALVVQALITATSFISAEQDLCPYKWSEQPSDQALTCDPQGAYIRMKCSIESLESVSVTWFMTNNSSDAGVDGNEIMEGGLFNIVPSTTKGNITFAAVVFPAQECTFGYYWCEITFLSMDMTTSSAIVAVISNSSLPPCSNISRPYDPPSNTNIVCAVKGFGASEIASSNPSTNPPTALFSTIPTEKSVSSSSTLTSVNMTSSQAIVPVYTTASFSKFISPSAISSATNTNIEMASSYFYTSYYPIEPPISTSQLPPSVNTSPGPNATPSIPILLIVPGVCILLLVFVTVGVITVICCACHKKGWYKKSSVSSSEICLAARNVSISHSMEQVSGMINSQTGAKTEHKLEKKHLSKSLDLSLLPESHVYVNSAMILQKTPTNPNEGYANPKELSDSISSVQFEQTSTLRRDQTTTFPRPKRSQSVKLEKGAVFTNPTNVSCTTKPEPEYADPKKVLSSSISSRISQKAQGKAESASGYTVPFGCIPASAKQRANTLAHGSTANFPSPVQYSHLKPLSGKQANFQDHIGSNGNKSKTATKESGYAEPWDIKGAIPTGVKHGAIKSTSRAATLMAPRRSKTVPQLEIITLPPSQGSIGIEQQALEKQEGSLHSLTSSQRTIGDQRTGTSSNSVSSLENHYDEPWDLKNIPTGVRRGPAKNRSATLRSRPKPDMIELVDDDSKN